MRKFFIVALISKVKLPETSWSRQTFPYFLQECGLWTAKHINVLGKGKVSETKVCLVCFKSIKFHKLSSKLCMKWRKAEILEFSFKDAGELPVFQKLNLWLKSSAFRVIRNSLNYKRIMGFIKNIPLNIGGKKFLVIIFTEGSWILFPGEK